MSSILMSILLTRPIEDFVGWALYSKRGHDSGLLKASPTFTSTHPMPTITVSAPDIGPSGTAIAKEYGNAAIGGADKIPTISWTVSESLKSQVKEWVLICEDADAPVAQPIIHGIYYGIVPEKMRVTQDDFAKTGADANDKMLKGGFEYGVNARKTVYVLPRPVARHGPHRYFWTVVGLNEKADFKGQNVGKEELLGGMDGKILGWGEWVGTYERK